MSPPKSSPPKTPPQQTTSPQPPHTSSPLPPFPMSKPSPSTARPRSGSKPKPSPLSIENITASNCPALSPRVSSASSLNTPLVNLPSPPYSGLVKSPFFNLFPLSPYMLGSPFPVPTSPRTQHHLTFPTTPIPPHLA